MEKEILEKLINAGLSQRKIADKLSLSQSTIKYWFKKFDLKTKCNQHNDKSSISEKLCPVCDKIKPIDEFYKRYGNRNDHGGYCKTCSNQYHSNRVKQVKIKMIEYKGCKCERCNLDIKDSHYSVFEFHHINPKLKDINFEKIKYQKWDKIKKELDKCKLLCANCHRLTHADMEG